MKPILSQFFSFDEFITPKIIKIIFWLAVIGIVIAGIGQTYYALNYSHGFFSGLMSFVMGVGGILLSIVGAKITCELTLLLFKIAENTRK